MRMGAKAQTLTHGQNMQELRVSKDDVLEYTSRHKQALAVGDAHSAASGSLRDWLTAQGREGDVIVCNLDLRGVDLSDADFSGVTIKGTSLEGADISRVSFREAQMEGICLNGVMAMDADFKGANLARCHFKDAKLLGSGPLRREGRGEIDFTAANLRQTVFDGAYMRNAVFTAADMFSTSLKGCEFENTRFNHANLIKADFTHCVPHFREAVGTRSHPVGLELVDAMVIGAKALERLEPKLEHTVTDAAALTRGVQRMAMMQQGEHSLPLFLQQQTASRLQAAKDVLSAGLASDEDRPALQAAVESLEPKRSMGFAEKEKARRNGQEQTSVMR
jgi:uncharacterized protein YjbI with pentapeptide repeats